MEQDDRRCGKNPEARDNVYRSVPPGSHHHEKMQTRQISATICRVYRQRTDLHSDRAYVQGQPS